jgi:hypothetical protein
MRISAKNISLQKVSHEGHPGCTAIERERFYPFWNGTNSHDASIISSKISRPLRRLEVLISESSVKLRVLGRIHIAPSSI